MKVYELKEHLVGRKYAPVFVRIDGVIYEPCDVLTTTKSGPIIIEVDPLDEVDEADTRSGDFV